MYIYTNEVFARFRATGNAFRGPRPGPVPRDGTSIAVKSPERKLVLVVEDEPDVAEALRLVLVTAGYRVLVVPDGESALATIASERPSAILADFTLPRTSGGDLGRAVRADPGLSHIPFVIASGHGQVTVRDTFDDYDAFLPKPLSPDVIVPLVAHLTRYGRPARKSL